MSPERVRRIEELYHSARELNPQERAAFLFAACNDDSTLQQEIESLLGEEGSLLDGPAWEHAHSLVGGAALGAGTQLGPYRVIALLGSGGMGEVYRATDSRLGRQVALKVLSEPLGQESEARARFAREAKVIAALNHPHICGLYDVGPDYLVMELVEGPTLAERIARGAMPQEETLAIARQIAQGLEAAHEKGIVHRDLKPANIKVSPQGVVKILDFGLATLAQPTWPGDDDPENSPTRTLTLSRTGVIMGTAAYMAPEQARGQTADKRADIWAFGVLLYEMLTGKRLFGGETAAEILSAVLTKEPEGERVPAKFRRLLRSCLEKDPQRRLRDIGDVWQLLEAAPPAVTLPPNKLSWAAAAFFALAAATLGWMRFVHNAAEPHALKLSLVPPENASFTTIPALSPDGRHVAFAADSGDFGKAGLWIRDLDSQEARQIPGTEGSYINPFWSPDSRFVAFSSNGKLKKIAVAGGPIQTVSNLSHPCSASWNRNDVILFHECANGSVLYSVPAQGGTATPATQVDRAQGELRHHDAWFLPDGHRFLYAIENTNPDKSGIYLGDLGSKLRRLLVAGATSAEYVAPGYVLFVRDGTLLAQPFDAARAQTTGNPTPIVENLDSPAFSASQNGVVAYSSGGASSRVRLTWFDRSGKVVGTLGQPAWWHVPSISPDGNFVLASAGDPDVAPVDITSFNLARGTSSRFAANAYSAVWSPDGTHIAFMKGANGTGPDILHQKATSGAGQEEKLGTELSPTDWSPDGRYIIGMADSPKTKTDIWVLPLFGDRKAFPYLADEYLEGYAKVSPDGRWLAYPSNPTGRFEIYVQAFPTPGERWQVSTEGGNYPAWSRDGKELFFVDPQKRMMAAQVTKGARFEASVPTPLFETGMIAQSWFAVSKDGRFLIPNQKSGTGRPITIVVNWQAGLKK
jgi:eukaryotic-like serine/threonine-protein kinase